MTRKLSITDARRVHPDSSPMNLRKIAEACDLQAIVHFFGDKDQVASPSHWAENEQKSRAIAFWALSHKYWLNARTEAREQLGAGCSILLGVQRDGNLHCTTWSPKLGDCRKMKGWSQPYLFDQASIAPFRTVFGFGNGGVPEPLSDAEVAQIAEAHRLRLDQIEGRS